ncbi:radical SAM family heme chaperone HemW [Asticcacaulis tiandongensis]|uniref:radical SAM family heme chaperone HemW n=1 Tax=Asticcacaulis tiandongensis TaxID=2565365 RepID=UPI0011268859|nr:radical SAM family heme chaperone HemW [Asticcacaulis tiandongensis]
MKPVALYIHWPYCARICPYCDFNVTRDRNQTEIQTRLFESIRRDLHTQAQGLGPRHLASVFFGGGTPSLMPPDWVAALIEDAQTLFPPQGDIEITLEANPTDAEIARYQAFRSAGINRLSIGIQSLDDQALKFLGRNHSAREALTGLETALSVFSRVSLDLIYALPDQTLSQWEAELTRTAHLGVEHISPYQLGIEPNTAFGRAARRGTLKPVDPELGEAFYHTTQSVLTRLGFDAYEVSNHAKGLTARSQHNLNVWEGVDYIGIGPGAHGRLTFSDDSGHKNKDPAHGRLTYSNARHATVAEPDLKTYISRVNDHGTGIDIERLSPEESAEEALMLGLRLTEGVRHERLSGLALNAKPDLMADGFLDQSDTHLFATPKGRLVLDRLLLELLS